MDRVGPFNTSTLTVTYGTTPYSTWQNANPGSGISGSVPSVEAWTHAIEEIAYCIEQSGQTPSSANLHQLWQALRRSGFNPTGINYYTLSSSFTVPANVYRIRCRVWGGGGGGGATSNASSASAGGNGGGYSEGIFSVTPAQVLTVTVGAGGTASLAVNGANGGQGGTSSVGALLSATGGGGGNGTGAGSGTSTASLTAGVGSGGQININGTGAAAGILAGGVYWGTGGGGSFGAPSGPMTASTSVGNQFPGGGGSGCVGTASPSAGGAGLVIIEY